MKKYLHVAFVLFLICAVAGAALALINEITAPQIELNTKMATEEALAVVANGISLGKQTTNIGGNIEYSIELLDTNNEVKAYILSLAALGYGGEMTIIASYNLDGSLIASKLMTNSETPGLGKKAEESWYMDMFKKYPIPTQKAELADPAVVSGATITFNGISKALVEGSEYIKGIAK